MKTENIKSIETVKEIFALYEKYGHQEYGENVTMYMHMMQAALIAEKEGCDDELVLAAFLHDIGHFFEDATQMEHYGTMQHDSMGAAFLLEHGFPEKMTRLVASHVDAKRYLTFAYPAYFHSLSEASKKTLTYQGGPMSPEEAAIFTADPLFEDYIRIRQWDDLGKEEEVPVMPEDMERMKRKMLKYLSTVQV